MARTPSRNIDVGRLIGATFSTWFRNLLPFTILTLIVMSPTVAMDYYIWDLGPTRNGNPPVGANLLRMLITVVCANVLAGTVTYGVVQQLRQQSAGLGDALAQGLRTLPAVIGTGILVGLRVFLFSLLLLVPGIMEMMRLFVAIPATVMERGGVGKSIARSISLTDGSRWQLFAAWLVTTMLAVMLPQIFLVAYLITSGPEADPPWWYTGAFQLITGPITATAAAVAYFQLRMTKEQLDADQIAAVFD